MLVNPSVAELEEIAVLHEGAVRCSNGAIAINTGSFRTGRSPNDRFIVKDNVTSGSVAWGKVNKPFSAEKFTQLWGRINEYLSETNHYESEMHIGASFEHGHSIKVKTEKAWHHLFLKHMFI
ncbi:MAG: phosphoenolpyruvate carboxykinase (ATP), partial [Legionellales bacterium]|nr:phosphoenolpyruvate carboxykinase (ATP) [Legionellales bacterium]